MSLIGEIAVGLGLGGVLAALFFGGLWWTVRRVGRQDHPGIWLAVSGFVRLVGAAAGFYAAALIGGAALLSAMAAFLIVRTVAVRRVGVNESSRLASADE